MILFLVLVWPRKGSGGLPGLARVAGFAGPAVVESVPSPKTKMSLAIQIMPSRPSRAEISRI